MKTTIINIARSIGVAAFLGMTSAIAMVAANPTYNVRHLASEQNIISVKNTSNYLLLPIQDNAPEARVITVTADNMPVGVAANVRLAREHVDYYVPYDLSAYKGGDVQVQVLGLPAEARCWKEMKLSGQHNYTNALAALALADAAGLPRASSLKALTTFTGLPHRFEVVLEHNGVRWINDSKATNVGSTEAALNGLQVDGTLHLLLGGDGKSADFSPLARYLNGDNVRLYCFGRDGAQLAALRPEVAEQTETMEQAMRLLAPRVQPGDMVLLSPACASLDQFKNFEQRGNEFARLAKELG